MESPMRRFLPVTLLLLTLLSFGCRAAPAPDAGYLQDPKLMKAEKSVPYNRIYLNPKYSDKSYAQIYVAAVNTDYVMAENIWEKATLASVSKDDVRKNVAMLAEYQRNAFVKACQNDPNKKFKVVDTPGPDTLILEMAIVQLVPSKAELQAIGLVPIGFVGLITAGVEMGASAATHSEDQGKGVIALEARTRDGATGRSFACSPIASTRQPLSSISSRCSGGNPPSPSATAGPGSLSNWPIIRRAKRSRRFRISNCWFGDTRAIVLPSDKYNEQ
jgi:hypothetical protein